MFIRYPGSKDRQAPNLLRYYPTDVDSICVPFGGTASVAFALLRRGGIKRVWINDIDPGIAAMWEAVRDTPKELQKCLRDYTPKAEDFDTYKKTPGGDGSILDRAFRKIVLHQISYSGLGAAAGSAIGGAEQKGKYKVDVRWRPKTLIKKMDQITALFEATEVIVTNKSWEDVLPGAVDWWLSVDPPYYGAGKGLYLNGEIKHNDLAAALLARDRWVLSYDLCKEVKKLYASATIERVPVTSHLHHEKINDVVITPSKAQPPAPPLPKVKRHYGKGRKKNTRFEMKYTRVIARVIARLEKLESWRRASR